MTRNFLVTVLSAFVSFASLAQQDSTQADTTAQASNKKPHQDLFFVDLTWDRLTNMPDGVEQQWYGRGVNLGLVYDYPFTKNGSISGAIGGGFASHNYYLNAVVNRVDTVSPSVSSFQVVGDTILDRGKISLNYVDIPFEVRFRLKENDKGLRWKFGIGGKVGYLINVHEKLIDNKGIKIKTYDYPNVTQWRYGVTARAGYGAIMVSAFYSLTPFFNPSNSTSNQHAFNVGISLVPF